MNLTDAAPQKPSTSDQVLPAGWPRRHPDRFAAECAALDAAGWTYEVQDAEDRVTFTVQYPLPHQGSRAELTVWFPGAYPHFPAEVYDRTNATGAVRHRDPVTGLLCLAHDRDHRPEELFADVLARQMSKLLVVENLVADDSIRADRAEDPVWAVHAGLEEATVGYGLGTDRLSATVVVADVAIPAHLDGGALEARYPHGLVRQGRLATGVVTHIWGDDFHSELSSVGIRSEFPVIEVGRWIRDPDYRVGQDAEEVWARIEPLLPPLEEAQAGTDHQAGTDRDPDGAQDPDRRATETIGLLVPETETAYRQSGESWVFLHRTVLTLTSTGAPVEVRWLATAAHLNTEAVHHRTPDAATLASKTAVLVGCGAIGHQIATDLARTGVNTLLLIDGDDIDPATASRQHAPLLAAGHQKATELATSLSASNPACDVRAWAMNVQILWEKHTGKRGQVASATRTAIAKADLVIDATANPNVTSFLGAIRRDQGRPFLAVAGTAGMWGGWVACLDPARATGCVECLTHHRSDPASPLPVPPADPAGWVNLPRCSEPTFTGTNADVATIAHHASRIAVHQLVHGQPFGGDYQVAALRSADGQPQPVSWSTTSLPPHHECLCNDQDTPAHVEQLQLALIW
ncbi:ThiF family adenylyltransferase [Nocardioides marinus]|uniref:Molybdopterin/thiamine biosynthesis adenylyltransferase n=1 Tax=Nocardioides marinus TaxID=374514 RepID=A0A7Y9YAB2_9ACTN|nr:ThiF family adenylyltransferase [Nocardioides marinus]NYI08538.1 molybdopterin/thiamine biosynthesis adenylyltransferase [Nocardioides marinus]